MSAPRVAVTIWAINYWPEPTGIGPYVTDLAEHLAAKGHDVRVVTTFPHYPAWRLSARDRRRLGSTEHRNGVKIIRRRVLVGGSGLAGRLLLELSYVLATLPLWVRRRDGIHIGVSPALSGGIAARLAARRSGTRFRLVLQDLAGRGVRQSGLTRFRLLAEMVVGLEMSLARAADVVVAISPGFVPELLAAGVGKDRIRQLPNWLKASEETLADRADDDGARQPRWPPDGAILLHAGSLGIKQGLSQLVDVARLADARSLPLHVVFMGDGGDRSRLEQEAAGIDRVIFVDPVASADLGSYLRAADVLVVSQSPSNVDMSFPSKLSTYAAAARPILAAIPTSGSLAEFLEQFASSVRVVPAGDPEAILAGVIDLLESAATMPLPDEALLKCFDRASLLEEWRAALTDDRIGRGGR